MPEGDSIFKVAAKLAPAITGKVLERVTTQGLERDLAGRTVRSVIPTGKHLVIELDNGTYVRAHLGMNGRFRIYPRAEGDQMLAKMSPGRATLAITVADWVAIWIGAPTIEIAHRRAPLYGRAVSSLGPDILKDDFDCAAVAERAAAERGREIANVLLDQRVACGIGNVYKSECLFLARISPFTRAEQIGLPALTSLYQTARDLMLMNLGPNRRMTTREDAAYLRGNIPDETRYYVYGRSNKACRRCEAQVQCVAQGDTPRWTWWCPHCQPQVMLEQPA